MYGEGISKTGELFEDCKRFDIIKKAGAWYSYKDEKIGQGSENAKKYLAEKSLMKLISKSVLNLA